MSERTPHSILCTLIQRLRRVRRHADLKAVLDEFTPDLAVLNTDQRLTAFQKITEATARVQRRKVPAQGTVKVKEWNEHWQQRLRAAEAKNGNDWENARELGIPYETARRARHRYCGPRQVRWPLKPQSAHATADAAQGA